MGYCSRRHLASIARQCGTLKSDISILNREIDDFSISIHKHTLILIFSSPSQVTQVKTEPNEGYYALQVGAGLRKLKKVRLEVEFNNQAR